MADHQVGKIFKIKAIPYAEFTVRGGFFLESRDPKHIIRILLEDNFDYANVTKDNFDPAKTIFVYGYPPYVIISDYLNKDYYGVISIDRIKTLSMRLVQNVPKVHGTVLKVGIWTIDKKGVMGEKLKWKLVDEVRRVFRANADYQRVLHEEPNDHDVESQLIYNYNFYVLHEMLVFDEEEWLLFQILAKNFVMIAIRENQLFPISLINDVSIATRESKIFPLSTVNDVAIVTRETQTFSITSTYEVGIV